MFRNYDINQINLKYFLFNFNKVQHISEKPTAFAEDESPDLSKFYRILQAKKQFLNYNNILDCYISMLIKSVKLKRKKAKYDINNSIQFFFN